MTNPIPNSLPSFPSRFVSRQDELGCLANWYAEGARLVTITGPPGIGKTRLALHYAENSSHAAGPEGAWFIDLSSARTLEDLCASIATELGVVSGREGGLVARVGHALGARGETLVVLDNFEQLLVSDAPVQAIS